MKHLSKLLILGSIFCLLPFTSCDTEELTDLNINPTAANELDWRFLFTNAQVQAVENRYVNGRVHLNLAALLIQQLASLQVGGERGSGDKYMRHLDSFNAYYDYVYENSLKTITEVIRQTGPDGKNPEMVNLHHMAQVLKIWPMHIMTDLYGNVPYSEANRGIEGIFFPAFDSQESIYKDMLAKLEAAASAIGTGSDNVGAADIYFGGDFTKWKKWANSMMLRLAMRISNADAATAETYVRKAISGGVMTSNDDLAKAPMASGPSDWFNKNGISRALDPGDWGGQFMMGKTLVDWLKNSNDPRLSIFAARGSWEGPWDRTAANQVGMPNGYDNVTIRDFLGVSEAIEQTEVFSRVNPMLLRSDSPYIMQTYAEVEFLLAEAALKGWGDGNAAAHYNKGVKAAMQQWTIFDPALTVSDADVDTYLAANPFDGTARMVNEQAWAANFMQWYEAYSNWRRTGYPVLTEIDYVGNISGGKIFRRIEYHTVEAATNPNLQTGGTMPDNVLTRVWWDAR